MGESVLEVGFTFAEGNASLDSLVRLSWTCIQECARAPVIYEASGIFERSEFGARWLSGLLVTLNGVKSTSVDTGKERDCCRSNDKRFEVQHDIEGATRLWRLK